MHEVGTVVRLFYFECPHESLQLAEEVLTDNLIKTLLLGSNMLTILAFA